MAVRRARWSAERELCHWLTRDKWWGSVETDARCSRAAGNGHVVVAAAHNLHLWPPLSLLLSPWQQSPSIFHIFYT